MENPEVKELLDNIPDMAYSEESLPYSKTKKVIPWYKGIEKEFIGIFSNLRPADPLKREQNLPPELISEISIFFLDDFFAETKSKANAAALSIRTNLLKDIDTALDVEDCETDSEYEDYFTKTILESLREFYDHIMKIGQCHQDLQLGFLKFYFENHEFPSREEEDLGKGIKIPVSELLIHLSEFQEYPEYFRVNDPKGFFSQYYFKNNSFRANIWLPKMHQDNNVTTPHPAPAFSMDDVD
nr:hypothetical protein [Lentinula edodes]UZS77755.1 hypothetical protein [Lentinula edodes]UZS77805.1 hypothetical protein [Lentinula edodes]UZS77855.1 hypothetical protein [Lentinula edodes]UZS77905.1 hypothetical protein [Lentinula edodes]